MIKKKSKFKPLYTNFLKLKRNVQSRKKLLNFKKQKWEYFLQQYKKGLKRYNKFKPQDENMYTVSKFPSKGSSYKRRFKYILHESQKFRLRYGHISKNFLKNQIHKILKLKIPKNSTDTYPILLLSLFEHRLDSVLCKSYFCISLRNARQMILHQKVFVNKKLVKTPSYILTPGDIITIHNDFLKTLEKNVAHSISWPSTPKYLVVNYKTGEIAFIHKVKQTNLSLTLPYFLDLEKIAIDYPKQ